jgi:hypothetical protein
MIWKLKKLQSLLVVEADRMRFCARETGPCDHGDHERKNGKTIHWDKERKLELRSANWDLKVEQT